MRPGEVRAIRQLSRGVQAQVCLGATVKDGYAVITIESTSDEVLHALDQLADALAKDARRFVGDVLNGQPAWQERSKR